LSFRDDDDDEAAAAEADAQYDNGGGHHLPRDDERGSYVRAAHGKEEKQLQPLVGWPNRKTSIVMVNYLIPIT
jgi:hypothetical protein